MMVGGERPELRGLNLEGLRRNGFTVEEVAICAISLWWFANYLHNLIIYLYMEGLTIYFVQGSRSLAWDLHTGRYSCLLMQILKGWKNVLTKWYCISNSTPQSHTDVQPKVRFIFAGTAWKIGSHIFSSFHDSVNSCIIWTKSSGHMQIQTME